MKKTILLPICSVAFVGLLTTTHAEARDYTPPTIVHSKSKATKLCKDVRGKQSLRKVVNDNVREDSKIRRTHADRITDEQCKFHVASKAEKRKYWNKTLDRLVAEGLLTRADKKALGRLPFDATVLENWTPTTDFGRQIKQQSEEPEAQANTGAGFVAGAIIGAAIGFGMAGPAGIAPGAAIGGAAGNLAETGYNAYNDGGAAEDGGGGDGDGE
jgi:hypothetical protein